MKPPPGDVVVTGITIVTNSSNAKLPKRQQCATRQAVSVAEVRAPVYPSLANVTPLRNRDPRNRGIASAGYALTSIGGAMLAAGIGLTVLGYVLTRTAVSRMRAMARAAGNTATETADFEALAEHELTERDRHHARLSPVDNGEPCATPPTSGSPTQGASPPDASSTERPSPAGPRLASAGAWLVPLGIAIACLGGVALIAFDFSTPLDTNWGVLIEAYRDDACAESTYAFVPFDAFSQKGDLQCAASSSAGRSPTTLFAKAMCRADGTVDVAMASTLAHCKAAGTRRVASGTCLPKAAIVTSDVTSTKGYLSVTCTDLSVAAQRFSALAKTSDFPKAAAKVAVVLPRVSLRPSGCTATSSGCSWPFVGQNKKTFQSSSRYPNRVSSMQSVASYRGTWAAKALLGQSDEFALTPDQVSGGAPKTAAIEAKFAPTQHALPLTVPRNASAADVAVNVQLMSYVRNADLDYPVGSLFNLFGSSGEIAGATYVNAEKYFHVRNSLFDLGRVFGPNASSDTDGMTLAFWMRASTTSSGFAFAVSDAVEDSNTQSSATLTRLGAILAQRHDFVVRRDLPRVRVAVRRRTSAIARLRRRKPNRRGREGRVPSRPAAVVAHGRAEGEPAVQRAVAPRAPHLRDEG